MPDAKARAAAFETALRERKGDGKPTMLLSAYPICQQSIEP